MTDNSTSLCMLKESGGDRLVLFNPNHRDSFICVSSAASYLVSLGRVDYQPFINVPDISDLIRNGFDLGLLADVFTWKEQLPDEAIINRIPGVLGESDALACPIFPRQLFCVGMNIPQLFVPGKITGKLPLIKEAPSAAPMWWMKAASSTVGPHEKIIHPGAGHTNRLIPEPELGLIIGRRLGPGVASPRGKDALSYLAGYCIFNDVSALDIEFERGGDPFAFNMAWSKSYPTFAPTGPGLTLLPGIDPNNIRIDMRINGVTKVQENTGTYLWSVEELIEYFSAVTILEPGDLIACGNLTGEHRIEIGDRIEIEASGIGMLANPVAASGNETSYDVPHRVKEHAENFVQTVEYFQRNMEDATG